MKYPENERLLIVRPCLKYICLGNKPASKLLSLLLYYARNCDEKETEYSFMATQEELIEDLIDEMDVKTLHRTAIPMLRLLGFLDVDGSSYRYKYTVHLNLISYLLANYKDGKREIASVLLSEMKEQLDNLPIEQKDTFPIVYVRRQLDNCLIQLDNLPIELEKCPIEIDKCLIAIRHLSNSKRGRKPSPAVHSEAISEKHRLDRDITDNKEKNTEREVAIATARSQSSQEISQDEETVKPSQKDTAHGTSAHSASSSPVVGNAGSPASNRTERQDTNKVTQPPAPKKPPANTIPKRPKQQPITTPVSPEAQRILDDWVSLFTKKIVINQGDIDAAEHLVPTNITCEEMRQERLWLFSTDNPQKPWYRKIGVCLADIDKKYSQWQSLQDAPKPSPDKDESNDHRVSSFGTPGYNFADEFYPSEAEKKRYRAAQAQAQEVKA